ncbi:MAG: hypothetical protein D3916_06645 [Candidatus Electrothrix sp. MAN1_4]|nr:hypothetical protein [Candidatus Electrothrix sp. MAN1_4]
MVQALPLIFLVPKLCLGRDTVKLRFITEDKQSFSNKVLPSRSGRQKKSGYRKNLQPLEFTGAETRI